MSAAPPGILALTHPGWVVGTLAVMIAAPIAFASWARGVALRPERRDTAWFSFIQRIQWTLLGFWITWFPTVQLLGAKRLLAPVLPPVTSPALRTVVYIAVDFLPAMAIAVVLAAIAYPVQKQLGRTRASRREFLSAAVWQQIALIVPIGCFAAGGVMAFMGHPRVGVGLFVAGLAAAVVAARFVRRATGTETHAVTSGELRDRLFEMGRKAGVRVEQLFVMSRAMSRLANAFAIRRGIVMVTDELLANLSRREVDAVLAHELAHLKARHPTWLAVSLAVPLVVVMYGFGLANLPLGLPIASVVTLLVFTAVARRLEYIADRGALRLGGEPEALISALAKIHRLNGVPLEWSRLNAVVLTHPTTVQRARAIARNANLSDARVTELLSDGGLGQTDHYVVTGTQPGQPKAFSTQTKTSIAAALGWALIGIQAIVPAAVIGAAAFLMPDATRLAVLGVAFVVACAASLLACDRLLAWPTARLRDRVAERLTSQGMEPPAQDGVHVGLAPDDRRRLYEGIFDWDLGFLFVSGDRIAFRGEETSFSLRRDQVTDLRLAPGAPGWIPTKRVDISWSDGARWGVLSFRPATPSRLTAVSSAARALHARLEQWRSTGVDGSALDPRLDLPAPAIGEVTSVSVRDVTHPRTLGVMLVASTLASAVACLLLGLPFGPERAGLADVTMVAFLVHVVHRIPYWRYQEPERKGKEPALERAA